MSSRVLTIDWSALPVHQAAETLPMMGAAELKDLAADIAKNGLQEQLVLWVDNTDTAAYDGLTYLLDGRNRLAALKMLGITDPRLAPSRLENRTRVLYAKKQIAGVGRSKVQTAWVADVDDPYAMVMSLNVLRRHLSPQQKRQAIADHVKLDPDASDRAIAKKVGVSPTTVGTVRSGLEKSGDVSRLDTRTDTKGRKQPARRAKPKPVCKPRRRTPISDEMGYKAVALKKVTTAIERLSKDDRFLKSTQAVARRGDLVVARDAIQRVIDKIDARDGGNAPS